MATVLGIDLSLTCTGIARVAGSSYQTGTIRKPAIGGELGRMRAITDQVISEALCPWHPDLVVIEGLAFSRTTGHAMTRAGLWWMVVHRIDQIGMPYAVMTPTGRARYATGKGNAGKADVMREVARRYPDFQGGEDEADALVLAAAGADHLGTPIADVPKANRAALDAVVWPELAVAGRG